MNRGAVWLSTILLTGCADRIEQYVLPDQVKDFATLYDTNCAGCHGADGRLGAARPLNDPIFTALIDKDSLGAVIAQGVPQTAMPAFSKEFGGTLTAEQIAIVAEQIKARWSAPASSEAALPPYRADLGDPQHGNQVFRNRCAKCHGDEGTGGPAGPSIVTPAFLALVSDQSLRTTVIAGRTDLGMPNWVSNSPGLTPVEVSDVVAWLSAHRAPSVNAMKGGSTIP